MTDAEAATVACRLIAAGIEFDLTAFWLDGHRIPAGTALELLDPAAWRAEWVPTFEIRGDNDAEAAFISDCMTRFYSEPTYAAALEAAVEELVCAEWEREYDSRDWEF